MSIKTMFGGALALWMVLALGGCQKEATPSAAAAASAAPQALVNQELSLVGENYCLGCSLKKEQGAKAQCSVYGHRHALRVESAKGKDGQALPSLGGQSLHYLDNDQSKPLLQEEGFHKKRVEVKGRLFAAERTLEVVEAQGAVSRHRSGSKRGARAVRAGVVLGALAVAGVLGQRWCGSAPPPGPAAATAAARPKTQSCRASQRRARR
jgi:hypothetical protein